MPALGRVKRSDPRVSCRATRTSPQLNSWPNIDKSRDPPPRPWTLSELSAGMCCMAGGHIICHTTRLSKLPAMAVIDKVIVIRSLSRMHFAWRCARKRCVQLRSGSCLVLESVIMMMLLSMHDAPQPTQLPRTGSVQPKLTWEMWESLNSGSVLVPNTWRIPWIWHCRTECEYNLLRAFSPAVARS